MPKKRTNIDDYLDPEVEKSEVLNNTENSTKKSSSSRSLRNKNSQDEIIQVGKYDFDKPEYELDPKKRLQVIINASLYKRRKYNKNIHADVSESLDSMNSSLPMTSNNNLVNEDLKDDILYQKKEEIQQLIMNKKKLISDMALKIDKINSKNSSLSSSSISSKEMTIDLLADDKYKAFHKKMVRQEARMIEGDIIEAEQEAECLQLLRDKLLMPHWITTLLKATIVNDPTDATELDNKRTLTMELLNHILERYNELLKLKTTLTKNQKHPPIQKNINRQKYYDRIDRHVLVGYQSSSDEEEEDMTVNEIRERRRKKRIDQLGYPIHIGLAKFNVLTPTYEIIAEPLQKSYVLKLNTKERSVWKNREDPYRRIEYYARLPNQIAQYKRTTIVRPSPTDNSTKEVIESNPNVSVTKQIVSDKSNDTAKMNSEDIIISNPEQDDRTESNISTVQPPKAVEDPIINILTPKIQNPITLESSASKNKKTNELISPGNSSSNIANPDGYLKEQSPEATTSSVGDSGYPKTAVNSKSLNFVANKYQKQLNTSTKDSKTKVNLHSYNVTTISTE
ncbi:hypothetical protein TBLA_0H00980 [Henningerozyma blattae CBS 6284]|uniref:Something about silencing protein 4 domain-containing protein n=1 Tax=Henningerozyma blattae (strain ATCC 34711 / CBS 6284 / DSM 70876 / NBRC 10599 / NRRL Y-10934 / UCD 77-7) TaxID=1071380 RepID=I2H7N4_HENB6|nr:hypothetical protein TBLA_0H00980 [Tetrapisispora blattae CBS 6284]CCH62386.1 hypothetical protein TBLA_0H00980 [Tetrapisispora blattae CBS 6284]